MTETYPAMNLFLDFCVIGILITGIWLFRWPHRAKFGNLTAAFALACAAALILYRNGIMHPNIVLFSLVIGSVAGFCVARRITMIQIPAMVAFQHGAGGVAAFFLSFAELMRGSQHFGMVNEISGLLGLAIGSLTFSGSMIAGGKLSNKLEQTPQILPKHTLLVIINLIGIIMLIVAALFAPMETRIYFYILIICMSILFGVIFSIRIGGADMPVLISFLNATAGMAAAFCGMIIENKLLISCGATVAASGSILTHVMCKAMNRSLYRVFIPVENFSNTTPIVEETSNQEEQETPLNSAVTALLSARKVIIIPGYGMALAQAQFKVVEIASMLESMDVDVKFAIHPVAGRMPGHMNVLLAEAEIDYDNLYEMDDINSEFKQTDVVLIFGACDVVNPSAMDSEGTPISGMPILLAHDAKKIIICNFDTKPGYSGVENTLYKDKKTIMLSGDAASTAKDLIDAFKK